MRNVSVLMSVWRIEANRQNFQKMENKIKEQEGADLQATVV